MPTLTSHMGALVQYCGHKAVFPADIFVVAGAAVVRASGRVDLDSIARGPEACARATHHLLDFPEAGFWRPDLGVFVVPTAQVELRPTAKAKRA